MRITILQVIFFLLTLHSLSFGQITFEQGYYVNNEGSTIDCKIKNSDWKNNPTFFYYKILDDDKPIKLTIDDVQEFGIGQKTKYLRANVLMDRTSSDINKLMEGKEVVFENETIFLNVLIEGQASLFQYKDKNLLRFFYNKEGSEISQLTCYKFMSGATILETNNEYQRQLKRDLNCNNSIGDEINYAKKDLLQVFMMYNKCINSDYLQFIDKDKGKVFSLTVKAGLNLADLVFEKINFPNTVVFTNETGYQLGLSGEFILPFYGNKFAIAFEPAYQNFQAEMLTEGIQGFSDTTTVDYQSIELPVGLRHYFYLNDKTRIFVNAFYEFDFRLVSDINYFKFPGNYKRREPGACFSGGFGADYNSRYRIELRYSSNRNIVQDITGANSDWNGNYSEFTILVGYKLF